MMLLRIDSDVEKELRIIWKRAALTGSWSRLLILNILEQLKEAETSKVNKPLLVRGLLITT